MILDIVSVAIILGSVVILTMIIGKRMRVVASIDVERLPQEQQANVRKRLVRDRLDRKIVLFMKWLHINLGPLAQRIAHVGELWNALHSKLTHIRDQRVRMDAPVVQHEQDPLLVAQSALDTGDFDKAEEAFIEVLRLHPRSEESYRGLSDLYIQKKDFALAYESLLYLWKLLKGKGDDRIYVKSQTAYDLWNVSLGQGKMDHAKKWIQIVLQQEPNNPKFLDAAIETYITIGDRLRAERVLETLQATNPENNKLTEFEERIKGLSY